LSHDFQGHARIAREISTPIQCGENWWGPLDMRHAIEAQASDYMMLDVMKIGGVSGWLRAAAIAAGYGIRISSHLWPELSAQLLCATPTAHWLEYADWWNPVLEEPLRIENGMAVIGEEKGSGISFNVRSIARL
jgi:mandelate racemase